MIELRRRRVRFDPYGRSIAAALVAVIGAAAHAETWRYRVEFDAGMPLTAQVTVELPALRRAQDFSVRTRGAAFGLVSQVEDPRCDGAPLALDSAGAWSVQGWSCARLTWKAAVRGSDASGLDARARETAFEPRARLWLFSEATSLLRPVDEAPHDGEIEFVGGGEVHGGAPLAGSPRRRVPARDRPPEFYVIGDLPGAVVREGNVEVQHVDAAGVDLRSVLAEQHRALRHFIRAGGLRRGTEWHGAVVWLAGHQDHGAAPTMLAGHRTLLISGAAGEGRIRHAETVLAWLLREQFARLIPETVPLWARESLAQYYAIRALRRSDLPPAAVAAVERRVIAARRAPAVKLREAQRRLQAGDPAARDDLHALGAAFWDRVDRAIVRRSGFRTLDSMLPRLLSADWTDDRLPRPLLERLHLYAGEGAIDELLAQYVGD